MRTKFATTRALRSEFDFTHMVYRDDRGRVKKMSAVCTHMGCLVRWNQADATWDCPCHGSRFGPKGKVLGGPAETPLSSA